MFKFGIIDKFKNLILPTSGPIHLSHLKYIKWSFLSNILVSTETALGSDNMLHAINYDSENVRTLNYIGKDIIGQIGGLTYISWGSQKIDKKPKNFLAISHGVQQLGLTGISITPLTPTYFLPIAGLSNIFSNLSWTGFGAINAKCINKLALQNNLGEIYTKISIVNMMGSSIGLLIGLGINIYFPVITERIILIPILGLLRIYTFNKAIEDLL